MDPTETTETRCAGLVSEIDLQTSSDIPVGNDADSLSVE
jgi:hypothetical protein